jgi:anaphase-promoting complex subunit 4/WD40 domain-containing protein
VKIEATWTAHRKGIVALSWAPASLTIASGGNEGEVRVWNGATKELITSASHDGGAVRALSWSPDQSVLLAGWEDGTVRILDPRAGSSFRVHADHRAWVADIAHAPDGGRYASASGDRALHIYDNQSGQRVRTLWSSYGGFMALAWSPDGVHLASASRGPLVSVWNTTTWCVEEQICFGDIVWSLDWHPSCSILAIAGGSGRVLLWHKGGKHVRMRQHFDTVSRAAFAAKGRFLATLSHDEAVEVREIPSLERYAYIFPTYPGASHCLATSVSHALIAGTDRNGCRIELRRIPETRPQSGSGELVYTGGEYAALAVHMDEDGILDRPAAKIPASVLEGRSSSKLRRSVLQSLVRDGQVAAVGDSIVTNQGRVFSRVAQRVCADHSWAAPAASDADPALLLFDSQTPLGPVEWQCAFRSWLWNANQEVVAFSRGRQTRFLSLKSPKPSPPAVCALNSVRFATQRTMTMVELSSALTVLLMSRAALRVDIWRNTAVVGLQEDLVLIVRWEGDHRLKVGAGLLGNDLRTPLAPGRSCLHQFISRLISVRCETIPLNPSDMDSIRAATRISLGRRALLRPLCEDLGPDAAAAAIWEEAVDRCSRQMRVDMLPARRVVTTVDVACLYDPADSEIAALLGAGMADAGLIVRTLALEMGVRDNDFKGLAVLPAIALLLSNSSNPPPGLRAAFEALVNARPSESPRLRWLPVVLPTFDRCEAHWVPDFLHGFDWHTWNPNADVQSAGLPDSLIFAALGDRSRA